MAINLKFKPSLSPDVVKYNLYYKLHDANVPLNKDNAVATIDLGKPNAATDGYIHIELNSISQLAGLDGTYDLGVAAEDDAGNISPLLTQGLANLTLDFVAPSPPTEASIYYN
jgi:hypothetical protein